MNHIDHTCYSMDSRVAILGANGTGKSTLLHLITGALQPCEGTVSKHAALKLAKYSQHSADQLPYDKSPIEYFQALFAQKFPEKDIMVRFDFIPIYIAAKFTAFSGMAFTTGSFRLVWRTSNFSDQATVRWSTKSVRSSGHYYILRLNTFMSSVVFAQLAMEHPHILLLGRY